VVADAIELLANAPDEIADSGEAVATSKEMLGSLRRGAEITNDDHDAFPGIASAARGID